MGRDTGSLFLFFYFRGLKCSGCWRVFDGGLGEKVLFRAG